MNVNLEYWLGKRKVETIYNKPKPVALAIIRKLSNTTHIVGRFKIVNH